MLQNSQVHLERVRSQSGECRTAIIAPRDGRRELTFQCDSAAPTTDLMDGLAAAALPVAMRAGASLRVHGHVSRGAIRGLTEFARAWASWQRGSLIASTIEADEIRDGVQPEAGAPAAVAWSGSLASTHTLVRHVDRLAPGAFPIGAVVRLVGLRPRDEAGLDAGKTAIASLGLPLHVVRTNALEIGLVDPVIGRTPIIAAALDLMGANFSCGLHARGWLLDAHRNFPRPGVALPDLLGGDRFPIRMDGGYASPTIQARHIIRHPRLVTAVQQALKVRSRSDRSLTALAFRSAGQAGNGFHDILHAALLPMGNPIVAAEASAMARSWSGGGAVASMLRCRVFSRRAFVIARDHYRWLLAMADLGPVGPR